MDQSFYIGATGAIQQMQRLNVQGNNIANVNTYGFKAEKARFTSLFYQNMMGIEDEQVPYGVGARMLMTSTDFTQGSFVTTGRAQDYAIDGDGFFALYDAEKREISFTRNGAFQADVYTVQTNERDEDGNLVLDEEGNPLTTTILTLTDGNGRFVLGSDGDIILFTDANEPQAVGIFDYANYDGMEHIDGTRFLPVDKNGNLLYGDGRLVEGTLEMSNVDLAEEMTKIIEAQRSYEMALKIVQTSDEIETTINNLRK